MGTPAPISLPVKKSVLRQLGIADNELPQGLARLRNKLLFPPSHTPSRNICANSDFSGPLDPECDDSGVQEFRERLKNIIENSPKLSKTFGSASYLDQIALVCLAAGWCDCRAPDCLWYRRKLEKVVPVCHSWPGLWDWVLCITSCSLRTIREKDKDHESQYGLDGAWEDNLLLRFRNHITACLVLTLPPGSTSIMGNEWDITGRLSELRKLLGTDKSGSIGRPSLPARGRGRRDVGSRRCPHFTPEFLT